MVFVKEDSVRNYGLKKELIFLFFPVAFMMILLVRKYFVKSKMDGQRSRLTLAMTVHECESGRSEFGHVLFLSFRSIIHFR